MWLSRLRWTLPSAILLLVWVLYNANQCSTTAAVAISGHTCFRINNYRTFVWSQHFDKIAGKDADVPFECNRPATIKRRGLYAQRLAELEINGRLICIDESGYNIYTCRTKDRALVGECVHREKCPRGQNMIVI